MSRLSRRDELARLRDQWLALVRLEPRLAWIEQTALAVAKSRWSHERRSAWWYGRLGGKERMSNLVGWERRDVHLTLSTPGSYDVAYEWLQAILYSSYARTFRLMAEAREAAAAELAAEDAAWLAEQVGDAGQHDVCGPSCPAAIGRAYANLRN